MISRGARLRSQHRKDSDFSGPEPKRRRLGTNGIITATRSGTGPRTRGMADTGDNASSTTSSSVSNGPGPLPGKTSSNGKKIREEGATQNKEADQESSDSSSESSESSDSEESDVDYDEMDRRREELHLECNEIDAQFTYIKEMLYKQRYLYVEATLAGIRTGSAKEYLNPLERLSQNMAKRIMYASNLRDYQLQSLQHKVDGEILAALQNLESDKALLIGDIRSGLEEKIHRLEEDRHNEFTSTLWPEHSIQKKNKKMTTDIFGEKKKKPVTVSGPFIVYMLQDVDIVEDWTVLKKAQSAPKRKFTHDALFGI